MRGKGSAAKLAAVACGVGCALCVALYTQSVSAQAEEARAQALERFGGEQVSVCVATRDLPAGQTVSAADVELRPWVSALLPQSPLQDVSEAVGRRLTSAVYAGEVVSEQRFRSDDEGLAVPEGLVAVSVPAKSVQVVGGAVRQGDLVDVYATGASATVLLEAGVPVLATSADDSKDDRDVAWVTLAVAPARVQETVAAAQTAQLYFALPGQRVGESGSQTSGLADASASAGGVLEDEGLAAQTADGSAQAGMSGEVR